jgi:two-component system LytT family response regulator
VALIRALVVDDEPPARRKVRRLLEAEEDVHVVGESGSGPEAIEAVRAHAPDLLVLDVQMPGLDGFGVLAALADEELPEVIFATAYDEYAMRAFEVHAVDYLLKPFDRGRFRVALDRARQRLASGSDELVQRVRRLVEAERSDARRLDRILVQERGRDLLVPVDGIDWLEASGNYVTVHAGARRHLVRSTLGGLVRRLPSDRFVRVHRSAAVNLNRVRELRPEGHGDYAVILTSGAIVPMSRRYRSRLKGVLGDLG